MTEQARTTSIVESDLDVMVLTPDRLDDLAVLFDQPGDPRWCWCASFHIRGSVKARPPDLNRELLTERTVSGPSPGLLGDRDGRVVAWVSVGPRESFLKLARSDYPDDRAGDGVWSIVCFVVDPRKRGRGLARAMLAAAVDHARAGGATAIEAYPIDPSGERVPNPVAYSGPLDIFTDAGFRFVGERLAGRTRWPRPIVRLEL